MSNAAGPKGMYEALERLADFSRAYENMFADSPSLGKEALELPCIPHDASHDTKDIAFVTAMQRLAGADCRLSEEDYKTCATFFCMLYGQEGDYRHQYSSVYRVILGSGGNRAEDTEFDNGVPARARVLSENVRGIIAYMSNHEEYSQCHVLECMTKLHDHIELENSRMEYLTNWNRAQQNRMVQLDTEMKSRISQSNDELAKKVEEAKQSFESDVNKAKTDYESTTIAEIEKSSKALQRDYVSILGIFAAIVMAFVSGSVYSSSILDNMASTEPYRLVFVMLCVGLFIFDLIVGLFYFVLKMAGLQMGKNAKNHLRAGNIVVMLLIVALALNFIFHFLPNC